MEKIVLIGFGGHGKSVADCIERAGTFEIAGIVDQQEISGPYPYLGTDDVLEELFSKGIRKAAMTIGYLGTGTVRRDIYERMKSIGFEFPIIADPSAIIAKSAVLGEGVFVGKNAIVNADANIGNMVIVNTNALVEHECIVEAFSHVAVGAILCGNVTVGADCLIGAGAIVIQGRTVESKRIVPAGVVIR